MDKYVLYYKRLQAMGGAERLLLQHAKYLLENNQDFVIVTSSISKDMKKKYKDVFPFVHVIPYPNAVHHIFSLIQYFKFHKEFLFICHSGYIEFGLACIMLRMPFHAFLHQPTSMSFNESDKFSIFHWRKAKEFLKDTRYFHAFDTYRKKISIARLLIISFRSLISQFVLRRASKLFVLSDYAKFEKKRIFNLTALCRRGAINRSDINDIFDHSKRKRSSKSKIKLITLSRLDPNKRISIIIEAVKHLVDRGYNVEISICGTGPDLSKLEESVQQFDLADNVDFLGFVSDEDINSIYETSDLFVSIDMADFRLTMYEVLLRKRKIVVSSDTEIEPNLLNSGMVFVSEPNSYILADIIIRAIESKIMWSDQILRKYLETFTWDHYFSTIRNDINSDCGKI